jgi:tRNA A22 N-methylase
MLRERLRAAAELLPSRGEVADVGAGDGELARMLAARQSFSRIIATEAGEGPFERLARACSGEPAIDLRFGRGLQPLRGETIDGVAILGMGARTILEILADHVEHEHAVFVLGPMQHAPTLREGLAPLGLSIIDERLAVEAGRVYELIAAQATPAPVLSWLDLQLGPILRITRPSGFDLLCKQRLQPLRARLASAGGDPALLANIRRLEEEYDAARSS